MLTRNATIMILFCGLALGVLGVVAARRSHPGFVEREWSYDWVMVCGSGEPVEFPSPFADALRQVLVKQEGASKSERVDGVIAGIRTHLTIDFRKNGQSIRTYEFYVMPDPMFRQGDRLYKPDKKQVAEHRAVLKALVENQDALKAAIRQGNSLQRVRAGGGFLEIQKERDVATEVLQNAVRGENKEAANEALRCICRYKPADEKTVKAVCVALDDDALRSKALLAIELIGSRAKAAAPSLMDRYRKAASDHERRRIIDVLKIVDPDSKETRTFLDTVKAE